MDNSYIRIAGARQHNLKNLTLEIPRHQFVVITGLSGSGKSSLAFDTLYAEGQRRYVESLSSYARQFLDQLQKPEVDFIEGLSPSIAIEQRTAAANPRSTIATTTEIYDYLRLLYASIGQPHDPETGEPITRQTADQIVDQIMTLPVGSRLIVLAPIIRGQTGEFRDVIEKLRRQGFARVRVDGVIHDLGENERIRIDRAKEHNIEVVVDRLVLKDDTSESRRRLAESTEIALKWGENKLELLFQKPDDDREVWQLSRFSTDFSNPNTGFSLPRLTPKHFSFNSHLGACPHCHGLGQVLVVDPQLVIVHPKKSLKEGALGNWNKGNKKLQALFDAQLEALAKTYDFSLEEPWDNLDVDLQEMIFNGSGSEEIEITIVRDGEKQTVRRAFPGIRPMMETLFEETQSEATRKHIRRFMADRRCGVCKGSRLKPEILGVTLSDTDDTQLNVQEFCNLTIEKARRFIDNLKLEKKHQVICGEVIREIRQRLAFLGNVGLDYLNLDRESGTLSGGESQRIRLATQIGSGLAGVLYVLDEPSIGLHKRDNDQLIETMKRLRDLGNTVIVVEHDEETIRAADHVIDMGPGAGPHGGRIVAQGAVDEIIADSNSLTGQYLSGKLNIPVPKKRRRPMPPTNYERNWLTVVGARENNLKNIEVSFPLGCFTCVSGISGSGKSTLVNDILYRALARYFYRAKDKPGDHDEILGINEIDKVIVIDQTPIGRSPRSNPATYTGAFAPVRDLFAGLPLSRVRGYGPGRFSFNVRGGRCESCQGEGMIKIDMQFLADVFVTCEVCRGARYNRETLEVTFKGKNIADVLDMTIDEAFTFFRSVPQVAEKLEALLQVGLGYLRLGQAANTLSGGEAQRVKIAAELARSSTGRTVYILDEPTTGLHFADIHKLLETLMKLRTAGNTLIVIEHNMEMIKCADWVIDMGPDGGERGGEVVAMGNPEAVAQNDQSTTGKYLRSLLQIDEPSPASAETKSSSAKTKKSAAPAKLKKESAASSKMKAAR